MFRVADASTGYWLPGIQTAALLAPLISTKPRAGKDKLQCQRGYSSSNQSVVGAVV